MAKVNSWLLINLGCEMLYIIDQRLSAQNIDKEKSAQVLRDITNALLTPSFFSYISTTFSDEVLSMSQARILLSDIVCSSIMRLDVHSLDKLLDLMVMIFKWQMYLMSSPDDLLSLTLRHLHGIGRLMPEKTKMLLVDQANQYFFTSWSGMSSEDKYVTVRKLNKFLCEHNVRISILIRMKLQHRDGSFVDKLTASTNDFFRYYIHNLGENIYEKINHFPQCQVVEKKDGSKRTSTQEIDFLFQQFEMDLTEDVTRSEETSAPVESEPKNTLDELKRKCKMDVVAPEVDACEDNFQELLNMLGGQKL